MMRNRVKELENEPYCSSQFVHRSDSPPHFLRAPSPCSWSNYVRVSDASTTDEASRSRWHNDSRTNADPTERCRSHFLTPTFKAHGLGGRIAEIENHYE